jgi:hypothetical protein
VIGDFFILEECKTTDADTLKVTRDAIVKICSEARAVGRSPMLGFSIPSVPTAYPSDWCAVPYKVQEALLRLAYAARGDLDDPEVQAEIREWISRI